MRYARKLIGLGMVMVGVPALFVGGAGWFAAGHRDPNGAFTADLAPVQSTGPVVVVPDVADLVARHGAAHLLTPGTLRVSVVSPTSPVHLVVMTADAARRYLDGVARTEVAAVGFATGVQPLATEDIAGTDTLLGPPRTGVLASGVDVVFDPSSQPGRLSLLIMRDDLAAGVQAWLVVGIRPAWFVPAVRGLVLGGGLLLVGGLVALVWRSGRRSDSDRPKDAPEALPSSHDLAEEAVPAAWFETEEFESIPDSIDGVEDEMADVVERDEQSKEGIKGRWGNILRRRNGRHAGQSTVDDSVPQESPRDRFNRESPYIHTAT